MENEKDEKLQLFVNDLIMVHMNLLFSAFLHQGLAAQYLPSLTFYQHSSITSRNTSITSRNVQSWQSYCLELIQIFEEATKELFPRTIKPFWQGDTLEALTSQNKELTNAIINALTTKNP